MAKVYVKFNGAIIKEIKLDKSEITFGRKPDNDIEIGHPTISSHHGRIIRDGEHFLVEDLNSTNGTYINGQRITKAALKNRDKIGAAGHILEYLTDDAAIASVEPIAEEKPVKAVAAEPSPAEPVRPAAPIEPALIGAKVGPAHIKIISGGADGAHEIHLKEAVTYIGTADQAAIKIKGFLAPSLAAAISRKHDGYFLKAIKPGYAKVNGLAIQDQILLENGATIEAGGTNFVFYSDDKKKDA